MNQRALLLHTIYTTCLGSSGRKPGRKFSLKTAKMSRNVQQEIVCKNKLRKLTPTALPYVPIFHFNSFHYESSFRLTTNRTEQIFQRKSLPTLSLLHTIYHICEQIKGNRTGSKCSMRKIEQKRYWGGNMKGRDNIINVGVISIKLLRRILRIR